MRPLTERLRTLWHHVNPFTAAGWTTIALATFWVALTLWILDTCA